MKVPLIFGIIVLFVLGSLLAVKKMPSKDTTQQNFSEITECIADVQVDFSSNSVVTSEPDVENVFMTFIENSKKINKPIFSSDYGNTWRFKETSPHGTYKGVKYWKVYAQWYSTDDNQWRDKVVFDVSENGEVTRLIGCI